MPCTFTNLYLPDTRNKLWANDVDLQAEEELLQTLSFKSSIPAETLRSMTLKSYEGYLFERLYPMCGGTPFMLPMGMRGRQSRLPGLRFCPRCLQEEERPYFRKKWRLSFSTACLRHMCFLQERCPICQAPVNIYRKPLGIESPCSYKCGCHYRNVDVELIDSDSYGLKALSRMYNILDNGFVMLGDSPVHSFLFFSVIHQLSKVVYFWDRTKGFLDQEVMKSCIEGLDWQVKAATLEEVRLKEQYLLFSGLMRIFDDYPNRLVEYCRRNGLGKTELVKDLRMVPFWYSRIVDQFDRSFCR